MAKQEQAAIGQLLTAVAPLLADQTPAIGTANYAGIQCTVHKYPAPRDGAFCLAKIAGRDVVLAEDFIDPRLKSRQWMIAQSAQQDLCVSSKEFKPPAHVRFRAEPDLDAGSDDHELEDDR